MARPCDDLLKNPRRSFPRRAALALGGILNLKPYHRAYVSAGILLGIGCGGAVALAEADPSKPLMLHDGPIGGLVSGGHGIIRSSRAIRTFAVNSFDYKFSLLRAEIEKGATRKSPEYNKVKAEIHQRSADRLLKLCESNRGIYIKAGQFVASLQHLPKEYTTTLAVLQDQARGRPFKAVKKVLEEEFGADISDLFVEFEEQPIAAASLAQVHRAKLAGGQEVAVKIQYPGLERQVGTDIATMGVLSKAVAWLFPDYKFDWIVPQFEENLNQQLDFAREGTNAEQTARNFRHKKELRIPGIFWNRTTRRVLCMEFARGCKIDDVEGIKRQGLDPKQVAEVLVEVFAEMVFCHGHLHGDPHPGNILVKAVPESRGSRNFELVLLDHGLYRILDEEFRGDFCRLWKALILADAREIELAGRKLGAASYCKFLPVLFTGRPTDSKAEVGQGMTPAEAQALKEEVRQLSMGDLSAVISNLPKDMFIVMRTDSLVRSASAKLGATPRSRLMTNAKYAVAGLSIRHAGGTAGVAGQHWGQYMRGTLSYTNLLCRLELWSLSLKVLAALEVARHFLGHLQRRAWRLLLWWGGSHPPRPRPPPRLGPAAAQAVATS